MFEFTTWHTSLADFFIKLRRYTVIGKQLFENFRDNSLKGGLSNATTFNPPHFSLVDTFKQHFYIKYHNHFSLYQHLHATYPSSSSYKTRKEWLFKLF